MSKIIKIFVGIVLASLFLCGCGNIYSAEKIESIKEQAYREGYEDGYDRGAENQRELDCEEFLIDGRSIRDIVDEVYDEFGMTPSEAFFVYDEYTYDWTHGGYTWKEYQQAMEIMYYTACIFPYDY
jgi:hypothetical protein